MQLPSTVPAALDTLLAEMSREEREHIKSMSQDDLVNTFYGLGTWIRSSLGLTNGNSALIQATGAADPDGASMIIINALWLRLWDFPEDPIGRSRPTDGMGGEGI